MYFAYYFIRIIREIFGRRKLQKIIILALLFIALAWCFSKLGSFAYGGLEGDTTYTDGNNSIYMYYDSYLNDLSVRLMNSSGNDVEDLIDRLSNSKLYSFLVMYGQNNVDMLNDFQHLRVVLFQSSSGFNDSSAYNIWHDMPCEYVYNSNSNVIIYDFTDMTCTKTNTTGTFYFPYMLINRYNNSLVQVLSNRSGTSSSDIVSAINAQTEEIQDQTTAIENQTTAIEAQTEAIESTDFDENVVNVDTSEIDNLDDSEYTGLFTTIFNSFNNSISSTSVEYVRIPLYRGQYLTIPSNVVSSKIPNTFLLFIQGFWLYVFGFYAFKFVNNLIVKIKDGSILDGYSSCDVISSEMM